MKIKEKVRDELRKPLPPEAIQQHPTKSFLSTIKAIYITERLNDIFGVGSWDLPHEIVSDTEDYVTVVGRIVAFGDGYEDVVLRTPLQYGGHKKTGKNTEPADGYKSAVTDCISKCASYLEIGIDVFKGLHDTKGKKPDKKRQPKPQPKKEPPIENPSLMTSPQRKKLFAMCSEMGFDKANSKKLYDHQLGEGEATKAWASDFIERFDEICKDFIDA